MSTIKHPNIVQFIGIHFEKTVDPVLIMEYLPMSLTNFLDDHNKIHDLLKTSILLDISKGLLYLHSQSPPIIHRDLTANNILLTSQHRAKIADLGASRAFNPDPTMSFDYFSACPGMQSHMPPEALASNTTYRLNKEDIEKLDVFSFGNIILHVFAHEFPSLLPSYDEGTNLPRSEVERRQNIIKKIKDGSLKKFCISCLDNLPQKRPATSELVNFFHIELQELSLRTVDLRLVENDSISKPEHEIKNLPRGKHNSYIAFIMFCS